MPQQNHNVFLELARTAARVPNRRAIVAARGRDEQNQLLYAELTFDALLRDVERCSEAFFARGIGKGTRVLLLVMPGCDFVVIVHALVRLGAVPVFIDAGHPIDRLITLIKEAAPEALIGIPLAFMLKTAQPETFASVRICVSVGGDVAGVERYEDIQAAQHPACAPAAMALDDLMSIAFTSGSTGLPKGVECTPRMFRSMGGPLRKERYAFSDEEIDLVTFPIMLLAQPPLGITLVLPELDAAAPGKVDPARIVDILVAQRCTSSLGSPVFWSRVAEHCLEHGITLPSLRCVLLAGAPVSAALLTRLGEVLPNCICHTPIGSTECGSLASIDSREIAVETAADTERGRGVCVGRPFADHEIRVIEMRSEALPSWAEAELLGVGQIGEIVIRGPGVSERYFERPEATRQAKIYDNDGSVWHRMGDAGYLDAKGRLWFCGRLAQIIEHAGKRYYPVMVESIFNADARIFRSGLVLASAGQLVLCVELRCSHTPHDLQRIAAELRAKAHALDVPLSHVLVHADGFPVDARHNAKIDYPALTAWTDEQLARDLIF